MKCKLSSRTHHTDATSRIHSNTMNRALPVFLRRAGVVIVFKEDSPQSMTLLKGMSTIAIKSAPADIKQVATPLSYAIRTFATMNPFAVDAPDGESDADMESEMEQVDHIIDDTLTKAQADARRKDAPFAVESPDGESDAELMGDIEEVQHIIDDAAELQDKEKIEKYHKLEEDVKKFHAKDPEHDW